MNIVLKISFVLVYKQWKRQRNWMLIALFAASTKKGGQGGASVTSEPYINPMGWMFRSLAKGHSWCSCPGQRAKVSAQTWAVVSAKLRGAGRFKGEGRSISNSCCSFVVRVVGCTGNDVGLFLVVHLQHLILIFNCSAGEDRKCRGLKYPREAFCTLKCLYVVLAGLNTLFLFKSMGMSDFILWVLLLRYKQCKV